MKKKVVSVLLAVSMVAALAAGCGKGEKKESESKDGVTTVKWLTSRPVDGAIDQVMREISEQYSKERAENGRLRLRPQPTGHPISRN